MKKRITKKQISQIQDIAIRLGLEYKTKKLYRVTMRKVEGKIVQSAFLGRTIVMEKAVGQLTSFTDSAKLAQEFFNDNFNADRARGNHIGLIVSGTVPGDEQLIKTPDVVKAIKNTDKALAHDLAQYVSQKETVVLLKQPLRVKVEKVLIPTKY